MPPDVHVSSMSSTCLSVSSEYEPSSENVDGAIAQCFCSLASNFTSGMVLFSIGETNPLSGCG